VYRVFSAIGVALIAVLLSGCAVVDDTIDAERQFLSNATIARGGFGDA